MNKKNKERTMSPSKKKSPKTEEFIVFVINTMPKKELDEPENNKHTECLNEEEDKCEHHDQQNDSKGYIDDVKGDHGNKRMMQVKEVIQEELIESDFQKINIALLSCRLSSFDLNQSVEGKRKTSLCFSDDVSIIQTLALMSIYRSYWNKWWQKPIYISKFIRYSQKSEKGRTSFVLWKMEHL